MVKLSNRIKKIKNKIDLNKEYSFKEALIILKKFKSINFIESVDIAINLGIDPKKSDQNIRGSTILPYGTGKKIRVAVFADGENAKLAKDAGADIVGMQDLADQIKESKINFDILIASTNSMHIVGSLGQILGPKGLMPNLKDKTVSLNISESVKNAKFGQIRYRNDKNGIIHTTIGKINFKYENLKANLESLLISLKKNKPIYSKGIYIKKIIVSTTMGVGLSINYNDLSIMII